MTWPKDVVTVLGKTSWACCDVGTHCEAGHRNHQTVTFKLQVEGPAAIPDWPPVPEEFARSLDITVYDQERYKDEVVLCAGHDTVSHNLAIYGMWEGWESVAAMAILADGPGWVVDIGCHVGWYALLAATAGHRVIAVDANPENLGLVKVNAAANGVAKKVTPVLSWIGPDTLQVPRSGHVRFLKADIEGLEAEAVRVFEPSFAAGDVDFAMVELTPAFNETWRDAHDMLCHYGMAAFSIPDKGDDVHAFAADPVGASTAVPFEPGIPFAQANVLFVNKALL